MKNLFGIAHRCTDVADGIRVVSISTLLRLSTRSYRKHQSNNPMVGRGCLPLIGIVDVVDRRVQACLVENWKNNLHVVDVMLYQAHCSMSRWQFLAHPDRQRFG